MRPWSWTECAQCGAVTVVGGIGAARAEALSLTLSGGQGSARAVEVPQSVFSRALNFQSLYRRR